MNISRVCSFCNRFVRRAKQQRYIQLLIDTCKSPEKLECLACDKGATHVVQLFMRRMQPSDVMDFSEVMVKSGCIKQMVVDKTGSYVMEQLCALIDGNEVDDFADELFKDEQFVLKNRNNQRLQAVVGIIKPKLSETINDSYSDRLNKF